MSNLSEEEKVLLLEETPEALTAYRKIPYALIRAELNLDSDAALQEFTDICKYYKVYNKGKDFTVEGSNGDYIPARLKYKMAYNLINKEARFLFAERPDIKIKAKGVLGTVTEETQNSLTKMSELINEVLDKNKFEDILLKAAKDSFIGKRVAGLVNFNEEDGITITFLNSLQFIYEMKPNNPNVLSKFICWTIIKNSINNIEKRIFKKKFTLEDDGKVYVEEIIYDGAGVEVEVVTEKQPILLDFIPAVIILNDGLSGDILGESEVELLMYDEEWYSKLSNADNDAQRKSMNPTKYTVDMESNSTKNLSTAAGSYWDLGSDQNLENPKPMVGLLEPEMSYSESLKTTLDRIKTSAYETVDVPNVTNESLSGVITSGKALKAIYWPLIIRCKEKMKVWGPALSTMVDIIIKGAAIYPKCADRYINTQLNLVDYIVIIEQNTPLPEDENEEKTINLAEVEALVMSKKTYMQRWYGLTDDEVNRELQQIALERQILEDSSFNNGFNGDNKMVTMNSEEFKLAGVNAMNGDGTDKMGEEKPGETTGNLDDVNSFGGQLQTQSKIELNASKTSSLIRIISQYKNGALTLRQAVSIMESMGLDRDYAEKLLKEEQDEI